MKQQTAVEWLWNLSHTKELQASDFEQALAMEKEQLEKAFNEGTFANDEKVTSEEYYTETYHSVESNEMIEDDVEKLAEEYAKKKYGGGQSPSYFLGFTDGYNKAKETLYTEEQVIAIVEKSRATGLTAEYIIQSLKQPKQ